jgi:hypothetical protein
MAIGCRSPRPQLSAADLKALMERNRQAQELFQQGLAQALEISVPGGSGGSK